MSAMILRGLAAEFTARGRQESYGLLLRGSRLWESYLGQVLAGLGFTHGRPQYRESGLEVYAAAAGPEAVPGDSRIFPDFYVSVRVVIDAKYKHLTPRSLPPGAARPPGHDRSCLTAADRHQIVAYMYAMGLGAGAHGALICPWAAPGTDPEHERGAGVQLYHAARVLAGWGGTLHYVGVPIPRADGCAAFRSAMARTEEALRALIALWLG